MNPVAVLGIIVDLYAQLQNALEANAALAAELDKLKAPQEE